MSINNYNSEKNQAIKEKFVGKEVFGCVSSLMERIIKCEMKEVFIERDILGSITTLMEDIIKSGRKDGSAEREILERTGALMESIRSEKKCEIFKEIENLYKYKVDFPDIENLKVHEVVKPCRGDVLETERIKIINDIKERVGVLKGEESFSELTMEDGEISEDTNKVNQVDLDARIAELENYLPDLENASGEQQKIYEWKHVSNFLHDRLREKGVPVWNDGKVYVWGRTSTGQAILFDDVISEICNDMEILEGQNNEWKI